MKHGLVLLMMLYSACSAARQREEDVRYHQFFQKGECDSTAFALAWQGYRTLLNQNLLTNPQYLTVVDFTKPSNVKRLFVLDVKSRQLVVASITAHGVGSDPDSTTIPQRFSNKDGSKASSVGFYITGAIYTNHRPHDSLGLCLFGLDNGFNDSAALREIVVHYGATEYKGREYVTDSGAARSYGCPALPLSTNALVVNLIKGGSCLFVYSDKVPHFGRESTVLNGGLKKPIIQRGPAPNFCSCNLQPVSR